MGWGWTAYYWYRARKRTEQRRREMAAMEARLRAEVGLPPLAPYPAPVAASQRPHRTLHLRRWMVLTVVVVLLLLLATFLAYSVVYGVQHHLIYPAPVHR